MTIERKEIGAKGESIAISFLKQKGFEILERNFRCKAGEIDIVARKNDTICLIEVRSLKNPKGSIKDPLLSIDRRKQERLRRLALYYIHHRKIFDSPVRIDCIGIVMDEKGKYKIDHVEKAV